MSLGLTAVNTLAMRVRTGIRRGWPCPSERCPAWRLLLCPNAVFRRCASSCRSAAPHAEVLCLAQNAEAAPSDRFGISFGEQTAGSRSRQAVDSKGEFDIDSSRADLLFLLFAVFHSVQAVLGDTRLFPAGFRNCHSNLRSLLEKLAQKLGVSIFPKKEL